MFRIQMSISKPLAHGVLLDVMPPGAKPLDLLVNSVRGSCVTRVPSLLSDYPGHYPACDTVSLSNMHLEADGKISRLGTK